MAKAYQYDASGYFAGEVEDYGLLPNNATYTAPQEQDGHIPRWTSEKWEQVEDHKGAEGYVNGQPFTVKDYGPLPKGWSATPPPPSLEEARAAKRREIRIAYDAALTATLTMPAETPGQAEVALAALDFAAEDTDGLADVRAILASRMADLLNAVDTAETLDVVKAVTVAYPV